MRQNNILHNPINKFLFGSFFRNFSFEIHLKVGFPWSECLAGQNNLICCTILSTNLSKLFFSACRAIFCAPYLLKLCCSVHRLRSYYIFANNLCILSTSTVGFNFSEHISKLPFCAPYLNTVGASL